MSLRSQPGYDPWDLQRVTPLEDTSDPGEGEHPDWQPVAGLSSLEVISRKVDRRQAWREGLPRTAIAYTLYADHRRGQTFPLDENNRIWHPEGSSKLPSGAPDYRTAFDITSVVTHDRDGIAIIDIERTTGS